jgi:hypothetical protein
VFLRKSADRLSICYVRTDERTDMEKIIDAVSRHFIFNAPKRSVFIRQFGIIGFDEIFKLILLRRQLRKRN